MPPASRRRMPTASMISATISSMPSSAKPAGSRPRCWRRSTGRRPSRHRVQGWRGRDRAGLEEGLSRLGRGRVERRRRPHRMGRPGPAPRRQCRLHRDVERGVDGIRARADAHHGGGRIRSPPTDRRSSRPPTSPKLISGEWMGTMQLTEPHAGSDVGALRTRAEPRRRRHLSAHRHQDLHHLWRARPHRQHHSFRAGARRRRSRGHQGPVAVPGAEIHGEGGRHARRAQRRAGPFGRAQAGHPRLADLRHGLWRPRRRRRLSRRRGKPRHGLHVHHDERGAARGRPAGRRRRRSRHPARHRLCKGTPPGPHSRHGRVGDRCRSSPMWTCAACSSPCARSPAPRAPSAMRPPSRSTAPISPATPRRARPERSAPPCSPRSPRRSRPTSAARWPRSASRSMAAWASSRRPARRSTIAMPASPRSTRAPTASRRSISSPARCRCRGGAVVTVLSRRTCASTIDAVRAANDPAFGDTATRLAAAADSLERATHWLLGALADQPGCGARRRHLLSAAVRRHRRRLHARRRSARGRAPRATTAPPTSRAASRSRGSLPRMSRSRHRRLAQIVTEGADAVLTATAGIGPS